MKLTPLLVYLFLFVACQSTTPKEEESKQAPNIIIILTDDQGYGDLSSFGAKDIQTPNIDALGKRGQSILVFMCLNLNVRLPVQGY